MIPMQDEWTITQKPEEGLIMPFGGGGLLADFTLTRGKNLTVTTYSATQQEEETAEASEEQEHAAGLVRSFGNAFTSSPPERTPFQCPAECTTCCKRYEDTLMWRQDKTVFKCIIHSDP